MEPMAEEILSGAKRIEEQIRTDRRQLHREAEVGRELPKTAAYVARRLEEMGYDPRPLGGGLTAEITGRDTGRCILLRADMDALSIREETDLPFRAENGAMHACGHDMHTAMLLGAAQLLRDRREGLNGTVRLVFQPDEEGFTGAKSMLAAGVLEGLRPGAALALHVNSGTPSGLVLCGRGTFMAGCTLFRITVQGVGCHGAMPETGVDPVTIAAHICLALQEIPAREIGARTPVVVTVGRLAAGQAPNIIPQNAVIEGTVRTFDREVTARVMERIGTIAACTAQAYRGSARTEELASAPPLVNDSALMDRAADWSRQLLGEQGVYLLEEGGMGSEDFASYTYEVPSAYLLLGAGTREEDPRYGAPMHNERVVFNEEVLPLGAALHAYCAMKWLEEG